MTEQVMYNVREKLSQCREKCPGLSEEVYALADYMASVAPDELTPHKMSMTLMLCIMDIRSGRNGFTDAKTQEFPLYLKEHQEQVLAQAFYFPQLIDDIAEADFANEFRSYCKDMLHFDPPRREEKVDLYADIDGNYPVYVKVAVNWWANALQHPTFDNGTGIDGLFAMMMVAPSNSITPPQLSAFKKHLAKLIVKDMKSSHSSGICQISVDYGPNYILAKACKKAGFSKATMFPWKTRMTVTEETVSVSAGYGAEREILWRKD